MYILHIAHLDDVLGGVNAVVPQYVEQQGKFADTMLYNVCGRSGEELKAFDWYAASCGTPDLIVFHEIYRPPFIVLYKRAIAAGIPYIIIPHGSLTRTSQHKKFLKKATANLLLFRRFICHAEAVQCLSQNEYNNTEVDVKKFISTNGIRVDSVKTHFRTDSPRFVYVGRLEVAVKGVDLMLGAVKLAGSAMREAGARLDIYGPDDGGVHEEIRRLIESLSVGSLVTLHPPVTGEEKAMVLTDADVFIQTSRTEGMSLGLLEAIATGLVMIVSQGTGMGGLVRDYGAGYAAECTSESIAAAIKLALTETASYPEKGKNSLRMIEERFSWDSIVPDCIEEYRRIISASANAGRR